MAETDFHRDVMAHFIGMLKDYFGNDDMVYVSGNLLVYYEEGNIDKSVAPDVFVVHGVAKKPRRNYLTWEEEQTPDFVLEVSSCDTYEEDIGDKKELYASVLKVKEYYIYDPEGEIAVPFIGYRLVDGEYEEMEFVDSRLPSSVLGLELGEHNGTLRLYDPVREEWLLTPAEWMEQEDARKATESQIQRDIAARKSAEARAQQEADARRSAEAQLAEALAELERLRGQTNH